MRAITREMSGSGRRRGLRPVGEPMEARRLLSAAAPALPSTSLIPPAAEVANAQAVLVSKAGRDFTDYAGVLARVERYSRVTPAEFDALANDKAAIDAAIDAASPGATEQQDAINLASDHIDAAFTDGNLPQLDNELIAALSGVTVSSPILQRTFAEMRVIDRAARARVPAALQYAESRDDQYVANDLGPSPDTDIWPGSLRDPLVVYNNGQVGDFVHR
jgi:hypothetical protein